MTILKNKLRLRQEPSTVIYLYKKYCPSLFDLLDDKWKIWIEEDNSYIKEMNNWEYERLVRSIEGIEHETSFIDILVEAEKGNTALKCFLSDMDTIVQKLMKTLPEIQHKRLKEMFQGKLKNLKNWNYLNPFGELGVLDSLLNYGYILEQIEVKFPNNKPKDFLLKDPLNKLITVEILNIHAHTVEKQTRRNMKNYILKKIKEKIDVETNGVRKCDLEFPLIFVPVIWLFGTNKLIELYPFFKKFEDSFSKDFPYPVTGLCSYIDHTDGKKLHIHKFGTITSMLRKPFESQNIWAKMKFFS